jgi:protein gp37
MNLAETSGISWTDATFNPWIGCTRISPACDHCYAARDNERRKWVSEWDGPRRRTSDQNWNNARKWDRKADASGKPLKVFCASLADVFDNQVPDEWRDDLWQLIRETTNLRWMLLTKRIGNVTKMLPNDFAENFGHVGLMATVANQEEAERDIPKLLNAKLDHNVTWVGISVEPILGPVVLSFVFKEYERRMDAAFHAGAGDWPGCGQAMYASSYKLDWVISGGESGPRYRVLDMDWIRSLRDQCEINSIPFHHKQNGGGKSNGCLVDGIEHKAFPLAVLT